MKVESAECHSAGEEGQVIDVVVLVEAIGTVYELRIAILSLQHLVDEVEGRHTG